MKKNGSSMKKIVGRVEKICFPQLDLKLSAKIDTGAWRTALHVDGIDEKNGQLSFWIENSENKYLFDEYKIVTVTNSFGQSQTRYVIDLKMKMGKKSYKISVSLTNRKGMKYSCLIGRRFLNRYGFLVNVRKKNLNDRSKKI